MPAQSILPNSVRFSIHNPFNLIEIENQGDHVLFRAAYDNFSKRRKAFLIRQLAAEGYIPDCFEHFTEHTVSSELIWVVDRSLLYLAPEARQSSSRFMRRLVLGGCLLWLVELAVLLLRT